MSTTDKFSRAHMDVENSSEGNWRVNVFFFREDGTEYCRAVATLTTRVAARDFKRDQQLKFSEPAFYQGAGI